VPANRPNFAMPICLDTVSLLASSIPGVGHLCRYVISRPGQLSLVIPSWVGAVSTMQPMGGDALRLGSKGRYGSCVGGR